MGAEVFHHRYLSHLVASVIDEGKRDNWAGCVATNPMTISVVIFLIFLILTVYYIDQLVTKNKEIFGEVFLIGHATSY